MFSGYLNSKKDNLIINYLITCKTI